jgi:predicted Holliday junction resolvase-like endonuclease
MRSSKTSRFAKITVVFLILAVLAFLGIFTSCSREKAVEQLMADPQMSQMMLEKMWQTPATKDTLVNMVMNDPESMQKIMESIAGDTDQASAMMDMMMANEGLKDMMTEKTAPLHPMEKK